MKIIRSFLILTIFLSISLLDAVSFIDSMNKKLFEQIPDVGIYGKSNQAVKNIKLFLKNRANPNAQKEGKTQ